MKKTTLIRSVLLLIFLALMVTGGIMAYDYYKDTRVDTETLLETALNNLSHRETYRFSLVSELQLNNYNKAKTSIAGEKDKDKNIHVWGEIMNTELEMYQFADTHYRYNSATKQWLLLENSPLTDDPLLLMEILPETNFLFTPDGREEYIGKDVEHGQIIHSYSLALDNTVHIAGEYYTNFVYEIAVDAKSKEIVKTHIKATAKNNETNTLALVIKFYDINEEFTLTPPQ